MSPLDFTAVELLAHLGAGAVTSTELVAASLRQIERTDGSIKAFVSFAGERAMTRAAEIDERRRRGRPLGPLAGLPIAVKDVLCTRDLPTTCSSRMLENFRSPYDATLVERLAAADAIVIGKTNMDEFAMGGSTENSAFFPTCNPWDLDRVPGGSSGGAAAAVAARQVPLAIGTDTGGSIRQPAAFCGVVGLKPTYGRVSRYGLIAFASSLDQAGPMARTAEDAGLLLESIAGHDPRDSTSAPLDVPAYRQQLREPWTDLTIGVVTEHFEMGLDSEVAYAVRQAIKVLESLGARIEPVSLPHSQYGVPAYYVIAPCEASSNLARYDGVHYGHRAAEWPSRTGTTAAEGDAEEQESALVRLYRRSRTEGFGLEVKRRIMLGTFALSAGYQDRYYLKAQKVRRLIRSDYDEAFRRVHVVLGPTTPTPAFRLGEKLADPLAMYLGDLFTVGANLAGICALSLPCGFSSTGLPIGLQLQAPPFEEGRLLRIAHLYQSATDWHQRRPSLP